MSPHELTLPWRAFALDGLAPWGLVVARGKRESTLSADEVLDLCAAVELERVHVHNIDALLTARKRRRRRWTFADLAQGAGGLSRESAAGEVSIADVLRRAGLELVRCEVRAPEGAREEQAA